MKYADYEYDVNGKTLRVERLETGDWCWRILEDNLSSNDLGECYTTKREAKANGIEQAMLAVA